MRRHEVNSAFRLVKAYVEARNPRLRVICDDSGTRYAGIEHRDGSPIKIGVGSSAYRVWYRSKEDFVGMLLGRETKAAEYFREALGSVIIRPLASSIEELRLKYELEYGGFQKIAI